MKQLTIYLRFIFIRLFYVLLIIALSFGSYFYTVPRISLGQFVLVNPFYSEVEGIPGWLYDIDYFTFIFVVAILIIFILIAIYNVNKKNKDTGDRRFMNSFVSTLFAYLYSNESPDTKEERKKIKQMKRNLRNEHLVRYFLITLVNIHKQSLGSIHDKIHQIVKAAKYDFLLKAYLHSPYVRHKLFALKVISEFQLDGYSNYILKLTTRRNNVLHSEAIMALMKMGVYNNLSFLFEINIKLTLWDINTIVRIIREMDIHEINYRKLIESDVDELCVIGIMLARLNNQNDMKLLIAEKIGNANRLINEEAFLALIHFAQDDEDYSLLMQKFDMASESIQKQIIDTIRKYSDRNAITGFLNNVVQTRRYPLKVAAMRVLLDLDLSLITQYKQSDNEMVKKSCMEVLDINI